MNRFLLPVRRSVLVLGVLVGVGTAVAARPDAIGFRIARESVNLVMTQDAVSGPGYQLARSPGELRGRTPMGDAQLKLTANKVEGTLSATVVNLSVKKEGDTVVAEGGFGGNPVNLRLGPDELKVYVRDCTYRLKATETGRAYSGRRSCDRAFDPPSEVTLPDAFLVASPAEQATLLLLSL